jgi:hypothetical protein
MVVVNKEKQELELEPTYWRSGHLMREGHFTYASSDFVGKILVFECAQNTAATFVADEMTQILVALGVIVAQS